MGILPLKKCVNRDKCSFATKQRMFGVFAIDEILRYRGSQIPGSRTLCHPGVDQGEARAPAEGDPGGVQGEAGRAQEELHALPQGGGVPPRRPCKG